VNGPGTTSGVAEVECGIMDGVGCGWAFTEVAIAPQAATAPASAVVFKASRRVIISILSFMCFGRFLSPGFNYSCLFAGQGNIIPRHSLTSVFSKFPARICGKSTTCKRTSIGPDYGGSNSRCGLWSRFQTTKAASFVSSKRNFIVNVATWPSQKNTLALPRCRE
jgi:hypothetical protein